VPPSLPITLEPEEAVSVPDVAGHIASGDDIEVPILIEIPDRDSARSEFQDLQPRRRSGPPTTAVPQIDVRAVGLIAAGKGSVDDKVEVAILVDVAECERVKLPRRRVKIHVAAGEASPAVAVVNVDPPALKRRDQVKVPVVIEIPDDEGPTWHGRAGSDVREPRMEPPGPRAIAEVDLEADLGISDQDQVQIAVPVDIGELRGDIPVVSRKNPFRESPRPSLSRVCTRPEWPAATMSGKPSPLISPAARAA